MTGQIQPRQGGPIAPVGPARPTTMTPPVMTPREMMAILRRHLWLIIILTGTMMAITLGLYGIKYFFWPEYTAETFVEVLPQTIEDPFETVGPTLPSQELQYQFRNTKAAYFKSEDMLRKYLERPEVRELAWYKQFRMNWLARTFYQIRSRFGKPDSPEPDIEEGSDAKAVVRALEDLKGNLSVVPQRDGTYIRVAMTCSGPSGKSESAKIVNQIVNLFLREQDELAKKDLRQRNEQLTTQQLAVKREIDGLDAELDAIRARSPFANVSPLRFRDHLEEKLGDLETDVSRLQGEVARLKSQVEATKRRAEGEYDALVRELIERDPIANIMRRTVAQLEVQLAEFLARFGENHRRVRETRDALQQAREDLALRQKEIGDIERQTQYILANDELVARTQEMEIRQQELNRAHEEHRQLGRIRADYERVWTNREEKQALLDTISTQIAKVSALLRDPTLSKVKGTGEALPPLRRSAPRLIIYLPGGFILGLLLGVGLAFAIEMLNDLVRTPSDVMRHLHVPLLGMICHIEEDDDVEGVDPYGVARQAPYSITSECYRQLRTNLKLAPTAEGRKVLLVTSCQPAEGKTSVALNMSSTFVADDQRVLLIDANFRRPTKDLGQRRVVG
ncbi:MAG: GumC family protein, partial [Anaerolineae bacterium]